MILHSFLNWHVLLSEVKLKLKLRFHQNFKWKIKLSLRNIIKQRWSFVDRSVCKSVRHHSHTQTKEPITSKFGKEILERVSERTSKRFFQKNNLDVLKLFSWIFGQITFFHFMILCIYAWNLRPTAPKFGIEILKRDFEKNLKQFFQKLFYFKFLWISIQAINPVKNYKFSQNYACFCSK